MRRGFMLIEMMIVIGLMAIVGLVAAQVYASVGRASHEAARRQAAEMRFDQALHQLRRDVWCAAGLEAPSDHSLRIRTSDSRQIAWELSGYLTRSTRASEAEAAEQRWGDLGATFTCEVRGPTVVLHVAPGPTEVRESGGEIVFPSESMLLTRRAP